MRRNFKSNFACNKKKSPFNSERENSVVKYTKESLELNTFGFFEFLQHKKMIFCMFYKANNLLLHQSYLKKPTPSQINFIKNAKKKFSSEKVKKYRKCPALKETRP